MSVVLLGICYVASFLMMLIDSLGGRKPQIDPDTGEESTSNELYIIILKFFSFRKFCRDNSSCFDIRDSNCYPANCFNSIFNLSPYFDDKVKQSTLVIIII